MISYLNPLQFFKSVNQNPEIQKQHEILSVQPEKEFLPHPRSNIEFPEENWVELQVEQYDKPIKLQTYRYKQNEQKYEKPLGVVIIFHGYYNYANCGAHIAKYLADKGYVSVAFDYRGHGKSQGVKGLFESEEIQISDSKKFISLVEKEYKNLDIFLIGQSLGGQTCFLLGLDDPQKYKGIILFAPAIYDMTEHAKYEKIACKIIGKLLPDTKLIEQGQEEGTSRNPQIAKEGIDDPLMYNGKVIPSAISEILRISDQCQQQLDQFFAPFLIIQGGVDKWVNPQVCSELIEKSPSQDKSCLYYEDVWHNIWAEQEINDIIPKVGDWISERTSDCLQKIFVEK